MASRQRAEHVVSGILSDVTAACGGRDPPVSPALIGSVVKAVVLHPDNAFGPEKELSDDDLTAITRRCVDRLSDDSDVGVACLALQADMATARRTYGQRRDKGEGRGCEAVRLALFSFRFVSFRPPFAFLFLSRKSETLCYRKNGPFLRLFTRASLALPLSPPLSLWPHSQ